MRISVSSSAIKFVEQSRRSGGQPGNIDAGVASRWQAALDGGRYAKSQRSAGLNFAEVVVSGKGAATLGSRDPATSVGNPGEFKAKSTKVAQRRRPSSSRAWDPPAVGEAALCAVVGPEHGRAARRPRVTEHRVDGIRAPRRDVDGAGLTDSEAGPPSVVRCRGYGDVAGVEHAAAAAAGFVQLVVAGTAVVVPVPAGCRDGWRRRHRRRHLAVAVGAIALPSGRCLRQCG